jgi:hypothetical protein
MWVRRSGAVAEHRYRRRVTSARPAKSLAALRGGLCSLTNGFSRGTFQPLYRGIVRPGPCGGARGHVPRQPRSPYQLVGRDTPRTKCSRRSSAHCSSPRPGAGLGPGDCRHVSGGLERVLIDRGETVVRLPPRLMAGAHRRAQEALERLGTARQQGACGRRVTVPFGTLRRPNAAVQNANGTAGRRDSPGGQGCAQ